MRESNWFPVIKKCHVQQILSVVMVHLGHGILEELHRYVLIFKRVSSIKLYVRT